MACTAVISGCSDLGSGRSDRCTCFHPLWRMLCLTQMSSSNVCSTEQSTNRNGNPVIRQNLLCGQVVPHPSLRCGKVIGTARTKELAGNILAAGYDPFGATLLLVAVEIDEYVEGGPSMKFSEHFNATAATDPDHYINPALNTLFPGLSHNTRNL